MRKDKNLLFFFYYMNTICILFDILVANKWIHEYGQEFQRRCSLNPEEWDGWSNSCGPAWSASQPLQSQGRERKDTARKWAPGRGAESCERVACICDWSPGPQGAEAASADADSTRLSCILEGGVEVERDSGQTVPEAKCSPTPTARRCR